MISEPSLADLLEEAEDPATPSARLREIDRRLNHIYPREESEDHTAIREALARHPSTPPEVLQALAGSHPEAFCQNPVAPLLGLEIPDFLESLYAEQALALLARAEAPPLLIAPLVRDSNSQVREAARLHVGLTDAADVDWEAETRRVIERLPLRAGEALVELGELNLIPFRLVELLAGGPDRRLSERLLAGSVEPERRALRELLLRAAVSPDGRYSTLTDDELLRLAQGGIHARCLAAAHPQTPVELLAELVREGGPLVRRWAARNPALPPSLAEELAGSTAWRLRVTVARNPATPPDMLELLAGDGMPPVRAAVARHPSASAATLERLSRDSRVSVRVAVARNPAAPAEVLERLAGSSQRSVRLGVKGNPAASPEALAVLIEEPARRSGERFPWLDNAWKRRKRRRTRALRADPWVAQRKDEGSGQSSPSGRTGRVPVVPREALLEHRLDGNHVEVRKRIARDPKQPTEVLEILAGHRLPAVRAALAENPQAPPHVLARLAGDAYAYVLCRVAAHRLTPVEALPRLAPRADGPTAQGLLTRKELAPETLAALATHPETAVRAGTARHPRVTPEVLLTLTGDPCRAVRWAAFRRKQTPMEAGARVTEAALSAAVDPSEPLAKFLALIHPRMPEDRRVAALASVDWLDRLALTQNPSASPSLLERLAADANQVVRGAALARLSRQSPLAVKYGPPARLGVGGPASTMGDEIRYDGAPGKEQAGEGEPVG